MGCSPSLVLGALLREKELDPVGCRCLFWGYCCTTAGLRSRLSWSCGELTVRYRAASQRSLVLKRLSGEESACQCRRHRFHPCPGKIPWRRKWQPTPVFLPRKSHGQRSLVSMGSQRVGHDEQLHSLYLLSYQGSPVLLYCLGQIICIL